MMISFSQYLKAKFIPGHYEITPQLFTKRKLDHVSQVRLYSWIRENRIPNPLPPNKLHATVIAAQNKSASYRPDTRHLQLQPDSYRLSILGSALVLKFDCEEMKTQWLETKQAGAVMMFSECIPHISLTYQIPHSYDWSMLPPPKLPFTLEAEEADVFHSEYALAA